MPWELHTNTRDYLYCIIPFPAPLFPLFCPLLSVAILTQTLLCIFEHTRSGFHYEQKKASLMDLSVEKHFLPSAVISLNDLTVHISITNITSNYRKPFPESQRLTLVIEIFFQTNIFHHYSRPFSPSGTGNRPPQAIRLPLYT